MNDFVPHLNSSEVEAFYAHDFVNVSRVASADINSAEMECGASLGNKSEFLLLVSTVVPTSNVDSTDVHGPPWTTKRLLIMKSPQR